MAKSRMRALSLIASTQLARSSAECDKLTTVLKAMAAPTISRTAAEDIADRVNICGRSDSLTVFITQILSTRA